MEQKGVKMGSKPVTAAKQTQPKEVKMAKMDGFGAKMDGFGAKMGGCFGGGHWGIRPKRVQKYGRKTAQIPRLSV
jgi:hypothetical protein